MDDEPAGIIAVTDPIKATTIAALDALRSEGIRLVMLTGDNRTTAQAVASKLGIAEVAAAAMSLSSVSVIGNALRLRVARI